MNSTRNDRIAVGRGDMAAKSRLFDSMYEDFHRLAQSYLAGKWEREQMNATTLVHEAYIRLADRDQIDWRGRTHFFAIGACIMRQLLVDHARNCNAKKRGGGWNRVELDDTIVLDLARGTELLELDELLEKLHTLDSRQATIVKLRFFSGMEMSEIAESMAVSPKLIEREWLIARAWLRIQLSPLESDRTDHRADESARAALRNTHM